MQLNTMYVSNRMAHLFIDLERSRTVGKKRFKLCGLKQWKCIVHSSGCYKFQNQGVGRALLPLKLRKWCLA